MIGNEVIRCSALLEAQIRSMGAINMAVNICTGFFSPAHLRPPTEMSKSPLAFGTRFPPGFHGSSCRRRRASDPKTEGNLETTSTPPDSTSVAEDDSTYLWKLAAGSVIGAGVIKYGSIVFLPGITSSNLVQALVMISVPMVLAVLLLLNESRKE
ncbi:hypothetical protein Dimus_027848 [Dionaea muscipula]